MLLLLSLLALTVADTDLQPLSDDQQVHLSPRAYTESVKNCLETVDASELYCSCVVRGFQMFLPRRDWDQIEQGFRPHHLEIIEQIETACRKAAPIN